MFVIVSDETEFYPVLPCVQELDLEDEVVKLLSAPTRHYANATVVLQKSSLINPHEPWFGLIPAIRRVREQTDWDLKQAKEFVENIYQKYLDKITQDRLLFLKTWRAENGLPNLQEPVPSREPVK